MDIDLLSKMVKELILDNDRVVLPGLGSFVAEIVPATFSDKGYTINPPYRKLYFRSKPDEGSELVSFYAKSNSVSGEIAEKIIFDFVAELKAILFHKKTVVFPGLGRLRATKENNVFFVADEELDIYPEGFGLEPISLKTHQASASEVKAAVSDLKSILTDQKVELEEALPTAELPEEDLAEDELPVAEIVEEPQTQPEKELVEEPQTEPEKELEEEAQAEPTKELVEESENEIVEEAQAEPENAPVEEPTDAEDTVPVAPAAKKPVWRTVWMTLMWIVVALLVLTAAYVAVSHLCPEWIDQFLYTPEELEILNYRYE